MTIIVTKTMENGNIDVKMFEKKHFNIDELSCLMVTHPSTHGSFESAIRGNYTQIIHDNGGLVYMDGANMNAQVGLTNCYYWSRRLSFEFTQNICTSHGGGQELAHPC
jgi:glycine dehydrogenase